MSYFGLFLASICLAVVLTKVVRDVATKFGLAVGPERAHHIHSNPIPRLGGIAIFFTFLIICSFNFLGARFGWFHQAQSLSLANVLLPAAGLFVVGLIDDLFGLRPVAKLAAQILGGSFLYFTGVRLVCFHHSMENNFLVSIACFALTVGFVVLICNAINLIDGLDGLAAGAVLFSMVTIFTFALANGLHGTAFAVTVLAGSNLGFLVFNVNPASIFLGDSGSLFIGFMLSGLAMSESMHQVDPLRAILVPVVALALPLTDVFLTVIRRYLAGHSLFGADKEHIHHKLLELGLNQRQAVWVMYGVSAVCAVLSLAFLHPSRLVFIPVMAVVVILGFLGIRKLEYYEFGEFARLIFGISQQKQVVASNVLVRKAAVQLQRTRKAVEIASVLQHSLKCDFNGFRILLDPGHWVTLDFDDAPTRVLEKTWTTNDRDKLLLTMELTTSRHGKIGRISLEHSEGRKLLIDSDLLQRELRSALGIALESCLITMPKDISSTDAKQMFHGV